MIAEWLEHATTPCARPWREMGHLREIIAIAARHRRHRAAWAPHLEATRATIVEAAEGCARHDTALVAGSGLLLDVPVEALAARFSRVLLADVVHLRAARRRTRALPNVTHLDADVTGCLEAVHRTRRPADSAGPFLDDPRIDLVVSANVLSQIPLLPCAWLGLPPTDAFARALVEGHLTWLRGFRGRACLVTDWQRVWSTGEVEDTLAGVRLPEGGREWTWAVAPRGEIARGVGRDLRVRGVGDFC
jgi:hypothetical protein